MLKKILCVTLSAALMMGSLLGCEKTDKAETSDKTVINVWSSQAGTEKAYRELIDEWNDTIGKKEGIQIEYTIYSSDYMTIVESSAQNGTLPELLIVNGSKEKYAKQNFIVPIEDMPGGSEFLKEYGEEPLEGSNMFDGKVYYVDAEVTTVGLVYNKDMFKKCGIVDKKGEPVVPKTWKEYAETAKKLTHPEENEYGVGIPLKYSGFPSWSVEKPCYVTQKGSYINYDNLTYDYSYLKPGLEALEQIKNDKSYFLGPNSLDNDTMRAQFAAGRIGMYIGASYDVGVLQDQFETTCDWGVAEVPIEEGKSKVQDGISLGSGFCISANAKKSDMEKVMTVYKWFHSVDFMKAMYEKGLKIPMRAEAMKNADEGKMSKQWKEFASLFSGEVVRTRFPSLSIEGTNINNAVEGVWAGAMSPKAAIDAMNKTYGNALKKAVDSGTIDINDYK